MGSWWILWMVLLFIVLLPSIAYGWGYRGWGPPYPRHIQRRHMKRAAQAHGVLSSNHEAWGWFGDAVWIMIVVFAVWPFGALLFYR